MSAAVYRPAHERGDLDHGWLRARHSFSFGEYRDRAHMGFETLRVLNQDVVQAGQGFGTHGHRDMEIITYVMRGRVAHRDSLGNLAEVHAGEVQRMSAGSGVQHSEFNPSSSEELELLQIWILPEQMGIDPSYEQRAFAADQPGLQLLASQDARDDSMRIHQAVDLWGGHLAAAEVARLPIAPGRSLWIQMAQGELQVGEHKLSPGDGLGLHDPGEVSMHAIGAAEFLLFDLAPGPLGHG